MNIKIKDLKDKRAENAGIIMNYNKDIALESGLNEDQINSIEEVCKFRHQLHCNKIDVWNAQSGDYDYYNRMLFMEGLYNILSDTGIDNDLNWSNDDMSTDYDYDAEWQEDVYNESGELLTGDELYDYHKMNTMLFLEKINSDIEKFLKSIDEKYNTNYCPTGMSRIA